MIGRVNEGGIGIPVPSARVAVTAGNGAGQSTTTFGDGRFRLYGVAGDTRIEAKKTGYRDDFQQVRIAAHDQSVDFVLIPSAPPEAVEGSYALTISASRSCREALPEEARVRTYAAEMARRGRSLDVTLSGATFIRQLLFVRQSLLSGESSPMH